VLLICPEPLGHSRPAGVGIRFLEFARLLLGSGHSVTLLSPDGGSIEGAAGQPLSPESIRRQSEAADVAVVQGHAVNEYYVHARPIPTVVDLYDPYLIENFHYHASRGSEVFSHDHATLVRSVAQGDFFLCASEAQRYFYLGFMTAIGRLNPKVYENDPTGRSLLEVVPFGVQPPRAARKSPETAALLFGGIYDWYDPILAIDAAALAARQIPGLTLTFTRHPNPETTPQGAAAAAMQHVRTRALDGLVRFEPWSPYEERAAFLDRFSLALITFQPSIETDLSMRTRIFDYLWAGLPVITSSAPWTDEILQRYDAGVVVRSNSAEDFATTIVEVLGDRRRYDAMTAGGREFVGDHQWPDVARPLLEFCRAPRVDAQKSAFARPPAVHYPRPSLLARLRRRVGGQS
jgi:glycosyltransferase involved in cell wall biosynthesis